MTIYDLAVEPITARGKAAGLAIYALARRGKVKVSDVADKLDVRAQILRDIAPAVGQSTTGNPLDLPVARQRNLEWAADEIETAAELIRRFGGVVPRTAQDFVNELRVTELEAQKALLLGALRKKLSPLWVQTLDLLAEWHGVKSLAEALSVSQQQANNVCAALCALGLAERERVGSPHPDFAKSPYLYRAVAAARPVDDD